MDGEKIIYGGKIFRGNLDFLENGLAILIKGKKIAAVGKFEEYILNYPDAEKIDAENKTIMCGLIDSHRHIVAPSSVEISTELITNGTIIGFTEAKSALFSGITSVRDPGCKHMGIFTVKRAIDDGLIPGPTVYPAGPNLAGTAAPASWRNYFVDGIHEIRKAVRYLFSSGSTWIKVVVSQATPESGWKDYIQFYSQEELNVAVEESHSLGLRVSGHIEGNEAVRAVTKAGFNAIEHGLDIDQPTLDEMVKRNVHFVPTLTWALEKKEMGFISKMKFPEFQIRIDNHKKTVVRAIKAGVLIAAGTDSPIPISRPGCLIDEMILLSECGMTSAESLRSATLNAAAVLGIEDHVGKIEPGFDADLIIVDGNPINDLRVLKKIDLVIKHGEIVQR